MTTVAVLQTDLLLNSAAFRTGMVAAAQTATTTLGQIQAEAKKTAASIDMMSHAAEAFIGFEALKEGIGALIEAQVQMQQIHYTLVSATGSATGAADAFDFLKQKAQELGLNLQPASQAFGQLAAAASASGIPMEQAQKLFTSFGKASTTLHLSSEQSQHALLALTEMMSRGTIQARQLNQQLGFAIPGSAARFKAAVMEAIKGTDLAGQSFTELEKKGELITSRFMPQLIQALEQSGRGYQEAAQGLNAQINRLKTAWFDLKNDMSGGLFNDAATSSIKFMADNLDHIATTVEVVSGLAAARLLSSGITSGLGAINNLQTSIASTIAETEATAVNTAAKVANAEQRVVATAIRAREMAAIKATAAEQLAEASTQNEVTVATANYARVATQAARANAAYRASIIGLTESQAANTAAQAASSVAASTTIGSRLGAGALALVGGELGIAIAAVGVLGYAIYEMHEKEVLATEAFKEQAKALTDLKLHLDDVNAAYQDITSRPTPTAMIDDFKAAQKQIQATKAEIVSIQDKINELAHSDEQVMARTGFAPNAEKIAELQGQIKTLQEKIDGENASLGTLSSNIQNEVDPATGALIVTVRELHKEFGDTSWLAGFDSALAEAVAKVSHADAAMQAETNKLQEQKKKLDLQVAEFGMSPAQKTNYEHAQSMKENGAAGKDEKSAADEAAAAVAADQERLASLKATAEEKKRAATQSAEAARKEQASYSSMVKSMQEKIAADQQELAGGSKLTEADKNLLKVKEDLLTNLKNLAPQKKQELLDDAQKFVNLTNEVAARKEKNDELQREQVLSDKLSRDRALQDQTNARALEGIGHGSQWNTEQKEFEKLQDQYNRDKDAQAQLFNKGNIGADEYAKNIGAIQGAYSEAVVAQQKFYADQKIAQANWKNGAQTAFENFRDSAANVAGATESLFKNAFNGMADALTSFVTTGKLNFTSMVTSILTDLAKMELRILESKILQGIFDAFMPSGSQTSYNLDGSLAYDSNNGFGLGGGSYSLAGNRASGGPVSAGSLYQVNEKGPELLTTGGATYLMMGGQGGTVTPNGGALAGSGGGGAITNNITVVVQSNGQATSKSDTSGSDKAAMGKQIGDMVKGTVVETVTRMTQPGGLLWQQRMGQAA